MLLEVAGLQVEKADGGPALVRDVALDVAPGELVLLVGRSGCGKTLALRAIGDLLPGGLRARVDVRRFEGEDLAAPGAMRARLGRRIGWVLQDPAGSFHPAFTLGVQLEDALRAHRRVPRAEAREHAAARLRELGLEDVAAILRAHPHELSGGELQRCALAAALLHDPPLLVADEATSQLDALHRARFLDLVATQRRERGLAVLAVTHELDAFAEEADRILVMSAGSVVERAEGGGIAGLGGHEASRELLRARAALRGEGR
ncbi:MAG: ATP-binding cassette domain-containing protein [Planctomycetota bacterium]